MHDHYPNMNDPSNHGDNGPPQQQNNEEDMEEVIVDEVIDLDDEGIAAEDVLADDMGEMDLENADVADEEDEGMGAEAGASMTDDASLVFTQHTGSVFCTHVDPVTSSLAATGGEDDAAYVWKVADGSPLFKCTGHQDSVTGVAFSHDSKFLATADMSGLIKVWRVDGGKDIWNFEVGDLEWIEWHPNAPVLLAGTVDGNMWMWKIPGGDCKTFQSHGVTCNISKVMPDGKRACAGYQDGSVKIWDLKTAAALQTVNGHGSHTDSITSMDVHRDNNVILTGSTDITAKIINTQTGKVVTTFAGGVGSVKAQPSDDGREKTESVEAVAFCPVQNYAAVGTLEGVLTLWDIPSEKARFICQHQAGIVRLQWGSLSAEVFTATLDGTVHLWDGRTGKCERQWFGHQEEILDMSLTKDGRFLITASGDKTARVFPISR